MKMQTLNLLSIMELKRLLEEPLQHNKARIALLKKAIPSLESEFDDLGDVLLQFLRASVQNIQPACNVSDAHTRIGNTFLAIGVVALNVENMASFRPSIEHFIDVCASVLNTEGLSNPFIHHSVITCAEQLLQAFPEEAAHKLRQLIPSTMSAARRSMPTQLSDFDVALATRCVDFIRTVSAAQSSLLRSHANTIVSICLPSLNQILSAIASSPVSDEMMKLHTSLAQLIAHMIRDFANLPNSSAKSVALIRPQLGCDDARDELCIDDNEDEQQDDTDEDDVEPLPNMGLINISNEQLHQCLKLLIDVQKNLTHQRDTSVRDLQGAVELMHAQESHTIRFQLLPYLVALAARQYVPSNEGGNAHLDADDLEPCVEWLRPVLDFLTSQIEQSTLDDKTSLDQEVRMISTLSAVIRACHVAPLVLGGEHNVVFYLLTDRLEACRQVSLNHASTRIRAACIKCYASLIVTMDSEFEQYVEEFVFRVAPMLKNPAMLSTCLFACRTKADLVDSLIPKVFTDLCKALNVAKGKILISILESIGQSLCFVLPLDQASTTRVNMLKPYVLLLSQSLSQMLLNNSDEVGIAAVICSGRLLHLSAQNPNLLENEAVSSILASQIQLLCISLDEGAVASSNSKQAEQNEDLLAHIQMCTIDVLMALFQHNDCKRVLQAASIQFNSKRTVFCDKLKETIQQICNQSAMFQDECMLQHSANELLAVLNAL